MTQPSPFDLRTRFDGITPTSDAVTLLDHELPHLFATSSRLASADHLDLRPLEVHLGARVWRFERGSGSLRICGDSPLEDPRDPVEWHTDEATFAAVADDRITPIGLMTAGTLDLRNGRIGRLLDWWLVIRSVLDDCPVHHRGRLDLPEDLGRSFSLDDDPAEMRAFLSGAGFLVLRDVFGADEMAAVSAEMDAAAPSYSLGDSNSWWAETADGTSRLVRMQRFDVRSATTASLLADDRLSRVAAITGVGHRLPDGEDANRIEALVKPIGVTEGISDVPWHKDCSLGRHSYRCCSMTVGISVTGAGPGSGQLRVIAGSHRALVWPSLLDVADTGLPELALATAAGDVTVHLSCTLHMAEPPTAMERRVLYTSFDLPPLDAAATADAERELSRSRESAPLNVSQ